VFRSCSSVHMWFTILPHFSPACHYLTVQTIQLIKQADSCISYLSPADSNREP
jgi:hypothetical protein